MKYKKQKLATNSKKTFFSSSFNSSLFQTTFHDIMKLVPTILNFVTVETLQSEMHLTLVSWEYIRTRDFVGIRIWRPVTGRRVRVLKGNSTNNFACRRQKCGFAPICVRGLSGGSECQRRLEQRRLVYRVRPWNIPVPAVSPSDHQRHQICTSILKLAGQTDSILAFP